MLTRPWRKQACQLGHALFELRWSFTTAKVHFQKQLLTHAIHTALYSYTVPAPLLVFNVCQSRTPHSEACDATFVPPSGNRLTVHTETGSRAMTSGGASSPERPELCRGVKQTRNDFVRAPEAKTRSWFLCLLVSASGSAAVERGGSIRFDDLGNTWAIEHGGSIRFQFTTNWYDLLVYLYGKSSFPQTNMIDYIYLNWGPKR
jgi:hypothetical protein